MRSPSAQSSTVNPPGGPVVHISNQVSFEFAYAYMIDNATPLTVSIDQVRYWIQHQKNLEKSVALWTRTVNLYRSQIIDEYKYSDKAATILLKMYAEAECELSMMTAELIRVNKHIQLFSKDDVATAQN